MGDGAKLIDNKVLCSCVILKKNNLKNYTI